MKKLLSTLKALPASFKAWNNSFSPRITRFITESPLPDSHIHYTKLVVVSFISGVFLLCIGVQAFSLQHNMQEVKRVTQRREQLVGEIRYWQGLANKYKNYRDVYYKLAALQYQLGNISDARKNLEKSLSLDPNFAQARVLGEKIGD